MPILTPAALDFVAGLVRAHDPATLYRALGDGFKAMFPHSFAIATFHFVKGVAFTSIWRSVSVPEPPPAYWARVNELHPAFAFVRDRPGMPVCSMSDVVADADLEALPYYHEFMVPEGWRYALAMLVWDRDVLVGIAGMARRAKQGDFTSRERDLLKTLQPLLTAAWARIAEHSREDDARRAQELLVSTLPLAALVYSSRTRRVLFHNRAAGEAVARWRGEAARKRPRAVTTGWLPKEIVAACDEVPKDGHELRCAHNGMRASLRRMDSRGHFDGGVVLLVIEDDERGAAAPSGGWLQVLRDLSAAEQQVAREAARGGTNADIARVLGKSAATVKKQLESVYAKAGVTSRASLGALFSGLGSRANARKNRGR